MPTEQTKTTLFSFSSFRSAEKLTDFQSAKYYVRHPDETTGPFFEAIETPSPSLTKRQQLLQEAESFTAIVSKDAIEALNPNLFVFSLWLSQNRNTLTLTTVNTALTSVTALSSPNLLIIWNNLIYQILTMDSAYLREYLIDLLIANHFVNVKPTVPADDDNMLKLAMSTIALPKVIFSLERNISQSDAFANLSRIDKDFLLKYTLLAKAKLNIDILKTINNEIAVQEKNYDKTYRSEFTIAKSDWNDGLITARSGADIEVVTTLNTGTEFEAMVGFEYAPFVFTPSDQIVDAELSTSLSAEAYEFLTSNNLNNTTNNFKEIYGKIEYDLLANSRKLYDGVKAGENNTPNSVNSGNFDDVHYGSFDNFEGQLYSYNFSCLRRSANNYSIILVLNTGANHSRINSVEYNLGAPVSATFTSSESMGNNSTLLTVNLTPNGGIAIPDGTTSISFSGEIELSGGINLEWSFNLNPTKDNYGVMTSTTPESSNDIYVPSGVGITRIGIAEYKKVTQYLCCYKAGEVSHIENILAREYKERSTRRLISSEITTTESTESEKESLSDTVSSSRFEMQSQVNEVLSESQAFGVDVNTGYSKDPITIDISTNYSFNKSKERSNQNSISFSKDITQKIQERIVQKIRKERVEKVIEEFEEQNKHGFDNRQGDQHISGVYRWVDKVYNNQVENYGMRLQYEFMIPEPSRLYNSTLMNKLSQPKDPRTGNFGAIPNLTNASKIDRYNYKEWAAIYGAEVTPPPAQTTCVGTSFTKSQAQGDGNAENDKCISENVKIPDGYGLDIAYVSSNCQVNLKNGFVDSLSCIALTIADRAEKFSVFPISQHIFLIDTESEFVQLDKYQDSIPVAAHFYHIWSGIVNVTLQLILKPEAYEKWQLETFNKIITAYEAQMESYNEKLSNWKSTMIENSQKPTSYFREIENTFLKKGCISYLAGHANMGNIDFVKSGNSFSDFQVTNTSELDSYTAKVKFFEQAFEWNLMSYFFYPFYWANKSRWEQLFNNTHDDELFKNFIKAGMARVLVSVRPGFEQAVAIYMETGQIWNGGQVPTINDDLYISIVEEFKTPEYSIEEVWETKIPSTLTIVQSDTIALNASGLPCWCDEGSLPPTETIDPSEAMLGVYIEGLTP